MSSSEPSSVGAVEACRRSYEPPCKADEIVLRLSPNDLLQVAWGGIVSQRAGTRALTAFGRDDSYWLIFVNKGVFRARVDEQVFDIPPGHTLVMLPGESCISDGQNETELRYQWIAFKLQDSHGDRQVTVSVPRVVDVPDQERMAELLNLLTEEFHACQSGTKPAHPLSSKGIRYLLLSVLARLDPSEPRHSSSSDASTVLAERAKDYIRTNLCSRLSTSDMARALDCSPGHLGVVFRKTYGETPMNYILRTRVGVARALLRETRLSISQVATEVGFSSLNYFSRVFKRHFGMTPSAYRIANSHLQVTTGI